MKEPKRQKAYYFVDEAGDPSFYNRFGKFIVGQEGCSKILMLGFIETEDPKPMRQECNVNLYDGGFLVGEKDSREYLDFVKSIFRKAELK